MDDSFRAREAGPAGLAVGRPVGLGHANRLLPLGVALIGTALAWLLASELLTPGERLAEVVLDRGWTQPVTLGLFFWGFGHILRRLWVQRAERSALDQCRRLLQDEPLSPGRVPKVLGALFPLRDSLAAPVLGATLSHFRAHRPTRDEVLDAAHQAVDRAHDEIDADYEPLAATMWLLPLSGFLGTVLGMAQAIGSIDQVITTAGGNLAALAPSVEGLARAFDTTLLALVLVVPLKLLEVGVRGRDRRLMALIDRYLGAGFVQGLDLANLAQQGPEAQALERTRQSMERIAADLERIDRALGGLADRLSALPGLDQALSEVTRAARTAADTLPRLEAEVRTLRAQQEQPLIVSRGKPS